MKTQQERQSLYEGRASAASERASQLEALGHRLGNLRGLSFGLFVVSGLIAWSSASAWVGLLSAAGLVSFILLIPRHDRVIRQQEDAERRALLNEHAAKRVRGDWHDLPQTGAGLCPAEHPYASDLDLFGPASLYQRVSVAHTRYGQRTLARWLLHPAPVDEIHARSASVEELAEDLEFRQSFQAEGIALVEKKGTKSRVITDGPDPSALLAWIKAGEDLPLGMLGTFLSWLVPLATLAGIGLQATRGFHPITWVLPLALGLIVLRLSSKATSETFAAVSTTEGAFLRYGALLSLLEKVELNTPYARERLRELSLSPDGESVGRRPSESMNEFKSWVGWFDLRHNGMVYPFANALLLWDLHCTRGLQRWRRRVGVRPEAWFRVIGEFEALSSLAGLLHDDPDMHLPEVTAPGAHDRTGRSRVSLAATNLGHPLLPTHVRVKNDLEEFSAGEGLLITGSNMSGKSTFLRSVGVNAVLAFAGGPVCASKLRLPLCHLGTSIRIEDSLASGVSHFYAEVTRLAEVVQATSGTLPVLFLLDEILHGTNSRERQIGARWVFAELLEANAFGIITTHDMELCRLPEGLMNRVRQHNFRENVVQAGSTGESSAKMTFDYTLREGPVTSGNALRLMRSVGLNVPEQSP